MAISWGGYATIMGVRVRAGVEHTVSPANPSPSTSSVTVTTRVYLGVADPGWGNGSWSAEGDASGSGSFSWNLGRDQHVLVATVTTSVPLIYGQRQTFTAAGRVRPFTSSTGNVARSTSVSIPARPISAPAAFSSPTVTRVDDTRQNVAWTFPTPTAARPVTGVRITRSVNSGPFTTVANLPGTARSWADRTTAAGNVYRYNVVAQNSAGETVGLPGNVPISTTPLRPAAPTATKEASGDIVVRRPSLSPSATSWAVARAGGATLELQIPVSRETWTHEDPDPAQSWAYVVLGRSSSPSLTSPWSPQSNTIQLVAAPLAPSTLGPTVTDPDEGFSLQWQHNPVDGTPQRSYQVQTRASAVAPWTDLTGQVNSSESQHHVPAGTWSAPSTRQWRVRTWGQHASASPYSSTAILTLTSRPVAGITQPGPTHDSPQLTARWTYFDPEGSAQTGWRVELRSESVVLENRSGTGSATTLALRHELADGATYSVHVQVRDGAGLWSEPAVLHFTVTYAPPATPSLEAVFRKDEGYTVLTPQEGVDGTKQSLSHLRVERATQDGWQLVHGELEPGEAATHMLPPLGTIVTYRAVAVSLIGSVAYSTPVQVETKTKWVFLNHGPGYGQVVRVYGNLEAGRTFSRDKTLKRYAGRRYPVERAGTARERIYSLTGTLFAPWAPPDLTSSYEDFEALADAAAPVCVRDPEGVRMFVSTSGVDLSQHLRVHRRVSLTMTQVDYPEQDLAT